MEGESIQTGLRGGRIMGSNVPNLSLRTFALCFALSLITNLAFATEEGRIPITTESGQARDLYLRARDLAEKLRLTDARDYYVRATEMDPDFALAFFGIANTSSTANEFFEALEKAVALADKVSDGERMMILGFNAGVRSQPDMQRQLFTELVDTYPEDERARVLLANYYFGTQEYDQAIEQYEQATKINPDYSAPYNMLGYSYRFVRDYDAAEAAFKKYIELIPDEPNPYDSYAEFLMKVGRFEESIENYQKALEVNPHFVASYIGIGNNYIFMNRGDDARKSFQKLASIARNVAEKRQALQWEAVSYVHEGRTDEALEVARKRYDVAKADDDLSTMSGDHIFIGTIFLETGKPDEAMAEFREAVDVIERAEVFEEVKEATRRNQLYREARVALAKNDLVSAREHAAAYSKKVKDHGIPFEIWLSHELNGRIALQTEAYGLAVTEFAQANQQNPLVLLLTAEALEKAGKAEEARDHCDRAANFNGLNVNYAYARVPAIEMLGRVTSTE
jgi:tetratricopeptide (TPR) repeat protein